jgi:hypothetical protein
MASQESPISGAGWLPAAVALGGVLAIYVATLFTLHPSVFWSPDEGAKFVQMHSLLVNAPAAPPIAYGAAASDPAFTFYPSASIYPQPRWPSGVRRHWPEVFPSLSLPFFRMLGIRGLYLIPLACGILTAALAGIMARRLTAGAEVPAILLSGLASPLYFHSALFLEHSLACALALGSLLCGWTAFRGSGRPSYIHLAGAAACLAGFYALRDEALIFLAAVACAGVATLTAGRRRTAGLLGIAMVPLLLLAFPAGSAASGGGGRAAELFGDAVNAMAGLKDTALWRVLPQHTLHVLVNNPQEFGVPLPEEWAGTCLFGLLLCALSPRVVAPRRFSCWLAGVCLVAAGGAYGLCLPDRYRAIHGLLLPMPGLALAWLPPPDDTTRPARGERFLTALLSLVLVLHVLATWLLRRPAGGPEWGLRYAMVAYLLASILGASAVVRFARAGTGWRRFTGLGLAAALLVLSCGFAMRGLFELQVTKRDLHAFEREIRKEGLPVVTDQWWLAAALAPTFVRTEFYTLSPGTSDLTLWLDRLGSRSPAFLYVSYNALTNSIGTTGGLTTTLAQRRVIQEMTFSRFTVRGRP